MGENTSQIEREIRAERTELGRNLRELESKARDMTDLQSFMWVQGAAEYEA